MMPKQFKLFILLMGLLWASTNFAQNPLVEKRIYLLDVTKSMEGKGIVPTPNIFDSVKLNLITAIKDIQDEKTEIVIIPFTNTPHSKIQCTVAQKDSLINLISSISLRNGDTNIADAWASGIKEIDSTKINYIFLLTDGLHNNGPSKDELYQSLRSWKDLSYNKYFFAFYVMLTPNAKELEICQVVDETEQMWLIESLDINSSLIRTAINQKSNVFENKTIGINFVSNNPKVFLDNLEVNFQLEDNPYYKITSSRKDTITNNLYWFEISEITEKIKIPVDQTLVLHINHNKEKYPFVFFTPETIQFRIINRGLRKMTIKISDYEQGK